MTTEQPPRRVTEVDLRELKDLKANAAFKRSNAHDKHNDAKAVVTVTKADVDFWDKEYARLESELAASTARYHQELADRLNEQEGRRKPQSAFQKSQAGVVTDDLADKPVATQFPPVSEQDGLSQTERGKLSPVERLAAQANAEKGLAPKIEIGDFVMLKSGGPKMQVMQSIEETDTGIPTEFDCEWEVAPGTNERRWFKAVTVMFVERPKRKVIDDPHANVPRRKFNDLTPAEQDAAEQIDGDVNPRWKLPSGELVDSNLADGKAMDGGAYKAQLAAQDKPLDTRDGAKEADAAIDPADDDLPF